MTATVNLPRRTALPTLRRSPIPLREPAPARRVLDRDAGTCVPPTQGTLALTIETPLTVAPAPPPSPPSPVLPRVPPEHREWAATFVHASTEVALGLRSPAQLVRWTTMDVHATLQRRGSLAARARAAGVYKAGKPHVRSLRICSVRPGVYEICAVVGDLDRVRAVALRMEDLDGRWRVTALEIG
jgi:hypothetical protein